MSQTSTFGLVGIGLACGALIGVTVMSSHAAPQPVSSAQGQLTACVAKKSGVMRMVKVGAACKKRERAVTWGITGPVGSPGSAGLPGVSGPTGPTGERGFTGENGATGERGAQGVQGARGPSDAYVGRTNITPIATSVDAAEVNLPAGKYVMQAVFYVSKSSYGVCRIRIHSAMENSVLSTNASVSSTGWYTLQAAGYANGPATSSINCEDYGVGTWELRNASLIVTEVKTLHVP